jgi:hypothetical protein
MDDRELSPGGAAACARLDALFRNVGPELGRWMLELAERLAARGRSLRSLDEADSRPRAGSDRR